ncbi:unnamed protein product, partial [Ectocarpus sp. 4 AP-2014]
MQGTEGAQKAKNKQVAQTNIHSALKASANSGLGKNRVRELLCMEMAVQMFLQFSFFSSEKWRQTIGFEASGDTPYPELPAKRVKHLLVEMYVATKKVVMGDMQREIERAPLPIIHYGIDLWQCKISGLQ